MKSISSVVAAVAALGLFVGMLVLPATAIEAVGPDLTCDGLVATLVGTEGADTLTGTWRDDVIVGLGGDDVIVGQSGDDTICGGAGNDTIDGKSGDDRILGGLGNDVLIGASGADDIDGGLGDDTIEANSQNDTVQGGPGNDTINGGPGNDTLDGGNGTDSVDGSWQNDTCDDAETAVSCETITTNGETDSGPLDLPGQPVMCDGLVATLVGTEGPDTLTGTWRDDVIVGLGGDDVIFGQSGNDTICGGNGDDTIAGESGDDRILGGLGNDVLTGASGADDIDGGLGDDTIQAHSQNDIVHGGGGNDTIDGGPGNDTLDGGNGTDSVDGSSQNDTCDDAETAVSCETITTNGESFVDGEPDAHGDSTAAPAAEPVTFDPPQFAIPPASELADPTPPDAPELPETPLPPTDPDPEIPVPVLNTDPAPVKEVSGFDLATSIEVPAERDAHRTVFANADGTSTENYSTMPVHYQDDNGDWQVIDNQIVQLPDGTLTTPANAFTVTFEPMGPHGGVRITSDDGDVVFHAPDAAPVPPTVEPDGQSVRYVDALPGTDIVYTVTGAGVEEFIIVKGPDSTTEVSFDIDGLELDEKPFGLQGAQTGFKVSRPESFNDLGLPVPDGEHVFELAEDTDGIEHTETLLVGLDADYVAGLPAINFPIIIDPSIIVTTGAAIVRSYANYTSTGGSYSFLEDGYARIGNPFLSTSSTVRWRSVINFPYESYLWANVIDATLTTNESGTSGSGTQGINVYWASQYGFHYGTTPYYYASNAVTSAVASGFSPYVTSNITTGTNTHSGNLKYLYNGYTRRGATGGALLLTGNEAAAYTLKKFTATLTLTVNRWPNSFTGSRSGAFLVPTLTRPAVTDPDGDALTTRYTVYNTNGTAFANSGWITALSWTAPKVPASWNGESHAVKIEVTDGVTFNGETHIREWNGTWVANDRAPSAAVLTTPANNASTHNLVPTLTATAATDPDGDPVQFRFFTCTASTCGTKTYQPNTAWRTTAPWTATPTTAIGSYGNVRYWGVETYDGVLTTTSAINTLNLTNAAPGQALPQLPTTGAVPHNLTQTFTTLAVTDPDGDPFTYRYFYCTTTACAVADRQYMANTTSLSATFTFNAALWNVPLKWGIETVDSFGATNTSTLRTLTLTNAAPTISALAPVDNTVIRGVAPTFSATVTDPDGDGINYRYVVTPESGVGVVASSPWQYRAISGAATPWTLPTDLVSDVSYKWRVETKDPIGAEASSPLRTITSQGRLGTSEMSPMQQAGPVMVNLATGNLFYATGVGRNVDTVGGPMSVNLTYNSLDTSGDGLNGTYRDAANNIVLSRVDRLPAFSWGNRAPADSVPPGVFKAQWKGFIRIPGLAGSWQFAGGHDGTLKITLDTTVVYNSTTPVANDATPTTAFNGATVVTSLPNYPTIAGQIIPITIDYTASAVAPINSFVNLRHRVGSTEVEVAQSNLTQNQPTLPTGWALNTNTGSQGVWAEARVSENNIVLVAIDGSETVFPRDPVTKAFVTPDESDDIVALDTATGTVSVKSTDGHDYVFSAAGNLESITSAADTIKPAGARPVYTGTAPNRVLQRLEDRVDASRQIVFHYNRPGDTCPTPPTGMDPTPAGMLCRIDYPDQTYTDLYYQAGLLARISDPGDDAPNPAPEGRAATNLRWTNGRLTSVRDAVNNDRANAEAAGTIPTGRHIGIDDLDTEIVWNETTNRPTSITMPQPNAIDPRPTVGLTYSAATAGVTQSGIIGTSRSVTFDSTGRALSDTDSVGRTTTTTWVSADIDFPTAVTGHGRTTTTIYDADYHVTDVYGPAPTSACFSASVRTPTGACVATTPRTHTDYDHNLSGLTSTAYNNTTFTGAPVGTAMAPSTALSYSWAGSAAPAGVTTAAGDNWSARFTGNATFPTATNTNTFTIARGATDQATIFVNDIAVATTTGAPIQASMPIAANVPVRIRVDFVAGAGSSNLAVNWTPNGGAPTAIAGTVLKPGFYYPTRTITYDTGGAAPTHTSETRYDNGFDPSLGLVTSEIDDPGGVNLTTVYSYEAATPGSLLRRTRATLPANSAAPNSSNSTAYGYWGLTQTADNPCTPANDPAPQAGLMRYVTNPTPATGVPIEMETIYDALGRPVANRYTTETAWTCTTFDSRSRPITSTYPADSTHPTGRTVTTQHAYNFDPYTARISDPAGAIVTTIDALARTVSTTDVWGQTTTTAYDAASRAATTTSPAGTITNSYDNASRLTSTQLNGNTFATLTYDPDTATVDPGRLIRITYPSGSGTAGNGTQGIFTYDPLGRASQVAWTRTSDGAPITVDAVTRSITGRILTNTVDNNPTPTWTYTYDTNKRLAIATGVGHSYTYGYTPTGGCGANSTAGANTNRTTLSDNGAVVASYCYDKADRLTSTTQLGYTNTIAYDTHGNTTQLASDTYTYDTANRHLATTNPGVRNVTYTRDALNRIIKRVDTDIATSVATTLRYSYADSTDAADITLDTAGAVIEANWSLPGGVNVTQRTVGPVWSYPNLHGDTAATTDQTGAKQGPTKLYDPYGTPLAGIADNQTGDFDNAWLGQHQRPYEHAPGITPTIEMGARAYNPTLGRFLSTDPVTGASANNYDYSNADPINQHDLNGQWPKCKWCRKTFNGARKVVRKTYQTARFARNLPSSSVGMIVARRGGGRCGMNWTQVMVVCTNVRQGIWNPKSATTYGSVVVTKKPSLSPELMRHEAKHADQYAVLGLTGMAISYGVANGVQGKCNVFERAANFRDGGYKSCLK